MKLLFVKVPKSCRYNVWNFHKRLFIIVSS